MHGTIGYKPFSYGDNVMSSLFIDLFAYLAIIGMITLQAIAEALFGGF